MHHSDHYPIKLNTTFDSSGDGVTNFIPGWNLKKAACGKLQEFCDIDYKQFQSQELGITFLTNAKLIGSCQCIYAYQFSIYQTEIGTVVDISSGSSHCNEGKGIPFLLMP